MVFAFIMILGNGKINSFLPHYPLSLYSVVVAKDVALINSSCDRFSVFNLRM